MSIAESIQRIANQGKVDKRLQIARVLSLEGNFCTVELLDSGFEIPGVRLQVETVEITGSESAPIITEIEPKGAFYVPSVNSFVVVGPINDDFEYAVFLYSKLDSIKFLDGSFGGLIKIEDLVTKLNNLENKVNSIINTFNTHTHAGVTTGAGTSGITATPVSGTLTPTNRNDIENDLVTHGTV